MAHEGCEEGVDVRGVTLAVLAGGAGSRMGMAKGALKIGGKWILDWIMDELRWPGPTLLVTGPGRERPAGWERFGGEAVDAVSGEGPVRGVVTALEGARTEWTVVVAVDMPLLGREALEWLVGRARGAGLGLLLRRGEAGAVEPFPSIFRRGAAGVLRERLERGERSMRGVLEDERFGVVEAPTEWPARMWVNLNRPADVAGLSVVESGDEADGRPG